MINEEIIEFLIDKNWVKKHELLDHLKSKGFKLCERKLRLAIGKINKDYGVNGYLYIAHCGKGYKVTYDKKEILLSLNDKKKRALNMLGQYYDGVKAMGLESQISLLQEDDENMLREIVLKGFGNG